MDFNLTDEQRELQETARKFARAELPELARDMEAKDYPVPPDMLQTYGEMGFLGVNLPEQYGGLGLGHIEALIVLEEFAQISNAVAFPVFEALTGPVRTIERFGSDDMKAKILPEVIKGEKVVAVSMSEPDAGTALTDLATKATPDGNGYVVNGYKRWTSGGGHSDYYVTYCRFTDDPGAKGIGAILLEKDMPGMQFGKREELMGFRGIPTADYAIEDVKVPGENVIIGAGGFGKLMSA
ncbi:MAG: acyl-CoA dehydrogenase family protein, partial [Pseudomonadota bacterium]